MQTRHVLSFGGGVNSVALMVLLLREGLPFDEAVFADTGGEVPETYEYLDVAREYLAARDVPLTVVAKRGDSLYDTAWRRRVFPSAVWRWSTRDFKVTPIHRHYRTVGGHINQYMAIAWDEVSRMKDSRVEYVTNLFPAGGPPDYPGGLRGDHRGGRATHSPAELLLLLPIQQRRSVALAARESPGPLREGGGPRREVEALPGAAADRLGLPRADGGLSEVPPRGLCRRRADAGARRRRPTTVWRRV